MADLALAVLQIDGNGDAAPVATVPAAERYLVRRRADETPVPSGVRVLRVDAVDRAAVAARVRDASRARVIAVLLASEEPSPELAAALGALGEGDDVAFVATRVHRCLGRDVAGEPVVVAWRGDPHASAPRVVTLPGRLVAVEPDITTAISRLDRMATAAAAARATVGVADFVTTPLRRLPRRLWMRRRDGVPGLVLSVLETYGEIVAAAKVWERDERASRTRVAPSSRTVPSGFVAFDTRPGFVVVREDVRDVLVAALLGATPESVAGEMLDRGGRGGTWAITLGDGGRAVLRWYRRGGLLRHLVRDRYFGARRRPVLELAVTAEARRRGIPVPEVLGVRVDWLPGGGYRGAIVTREIAGAETLADAARRDPPEPERAAIIAGVARTVRAMHDRGLHHRDLNVANILLSRDGDALAVHVIDLDRAWLGGRVGRRRRRRALRRLARSVAKLGATDATRTREDRAAFHRAYAERA